MAAETNNAPAALTANGFTRAGYTFTGWNTAPDGSGTGYADGATYPFTADATLFAQWLAMSHTVTFMANGGTGSMAAETKNAPTALTANGFTRAGYTFVGWNTVANGSGTGYADGATYPFTADATLYAQWVALSHTVTFAANGGAGSMAAETKNAPTALPANAFTRAGYTFAGWNTAADGSGTSYADGATYPFSADATLYAQWVAVSHTVTFVPNGGTGSMAAETKNAPTALAANSFTRAGYAFAGWNTLADGSGTSYADGATFPFTADSTLYAQWVAMSHTVTFTANGGTGSMAAETRNVPTALTSNSFTRAGYAFAGWNTLADGTGTGYADGATYPFSADTTLYAQWTSSAEHTAPVIDGVPANTTKEATDPSGASLTFNINVHDPDDGGTFRCTDGPPGTFAFPGHAQPYTIAAPVGTHTIVCNATDLHGNPATPKSFTFTVTDHTPPAITVPADMTSNAISPLGTTVTYTVTATDLVDGAVTPNCSPSSGSQFKIGTTTVNCTATDAHGNTATKSFKVKVLSANQQLDALRQKVDTAPELQGPAVHKLHDTLLHDLDQAGAPGTKGCNALGQFSTDVQHNTATLASDAGDWVTAAQTIENARAC
jgi:uncharacterized repeat protein (TIGR02543 family)